MPVPFCGRFLCRPYYPASSESALIMAPVGFKTLIVRSLPGCMQELAKKSGCAESTIRRWLHRLRKSDAVGVCISGYVRNCAAITAVYSAGFGPDAPCRLKAKTSAQYSKEWRKRARKSGSLELIYSRKNALRRAETAAKRQHTWLSALGV